MARRQDPEHDLDPLLRRMLRPSPGESTPGCLDAETLAAWADRTLRRDELARVEQHAADCGRCRAMLSAFVRSEGPASAAGPADDPVAASFWRRWRLQWLMPVAAAATALAVYIAAPEPPAARLEWETAPAVALNPASPELAARGIDAIAELPPVPASARPTVSDDPPVPNQAAEPRNRFTPVPQAKADVAARQREEFAASAPDTASAPDAAAASSGLSTARQRNIVEPAPPTVPSAATAEAAAVAPSAQAPVAAPSPAELKDEVEPDRRADAPRAGRLAAAPATEAAGRDATVQWRLNDGRVEQSGDGGAWRAVGLPAGVTASQIAAIGTAGPQVVWLVGRAGLVLVSADGTTFRRTGAPAAADLVGVQARSGRIATVSAADGRQYETADGGTTWTPR